MKYRKLDQNGDYTFGTGFDFYKDVPEAVAQAVRTRLDLWLGEWFLDTSDGTPWIAGVLGKYTLRNYDMIVRARILDTEGVSELLSYESQYDGSTRRVSIQATIETKYGQIVYSGAI